MDFVINNYIIFIIIGVILLMALIGYIADNTNFEKKPKKEKVKKDKKKKEETVEQVAVESQETAIPDTNSELDTLDNTTVPTEELSTTTNVEQVSEISNDLNTPVKDDINMMDSFDLPSELTDVNANNVSTEQNVDLNATVDLNNTLDNNISETTLTDVNSNLDNNVVNTEENNGEKTEQTSNETNVDDIWKF